MFGNSVYFLNPNYSNAILNAATGAAAGTFSATATPAIHGYAGYFLNNETLSAVDTANGKTLRQFTGDGSVTEPAILVNAFVVAASNNGNLYVIDSKTGKAVWSGLVGSTAIARPMGAGGGMVFVPLLNNTLAAYGSAG